MSQEVSFFVNGQKVTLKVDPKETLLDLLRSHLNLKGTKKGCEGEGCGACTVLIDGKPVYSCMFSALKLEGKDVLTIEGLERNGELDPIQKEFINEWAFQCGYCTPGFIMAIKALEEELKRKPEILKEVYNNDLQVFVETSLSSHICRCTGYLTIKKVALKLCENLIATQGVRA
ncbi:hypothetical protein B9Q13_05515 [Candidatus Marsarchaeota G2 archaeon ECH_B_SAG-G16]|jgi:carbon-monoxide dehydrogenase small subunit|uniref:2Fe-2S ferredoxin-type domain-containing protein n=2 Tax=Candidatus Marsarchaeota group 2 TaxID=2203771 RepID=A0A2R6C0J3_9ARCH|nr:MAG: hypothetical protein B9Q13_05515 [Candidatus Marsarchaeota G2 archaeon ECH_B_SAG-G16]PSO04415.1 MAG: hypothetical protein B9Q12_02475 [Candidatus Marsarchaeota G2 archaeon ECH_B_SAG-G06]